MCALVGFYGVFPSGISLGGCLDDVLEGPLGDVLGSRLLCFFWEDTHGFHKVLPQSRASCVLVVVRLGFGGGICVLWYFDGGLAVVVVVVVLIYWWIGGCYLCSWW